MALFNAIAVEAPPRRPQRPSLEINVHNNYQERQADQETEVEEEAEGTLRTAIEARLSCSAPVTAMRHGTPKLPTARALRWSDVVTFDDGPATDDSTTPSTTPGPSSFNPSGPRRTSSPSSTDCNDQSRAMIATSNFKAMHQRLCEESRSRGNSTSVSKNIKNDSLSGRSSHEERRTNSTQLSTEEWSHLLELMDTTGNALISADDYLQHSHSKPTVEELPKYLATDTTPQVEDTEPQLPPPPPPPLLVPNSSIATDDANFTPLRMGFSTTCSMLSGPPNVDLDLQRAITAVDTYAANMRRLLTSWQDIVQHHFDAFAKEVDSVFAAKYPSYRCGPAYETATDHAQAMLHMIGQAVPLVSQMEDMYAVLLEMGAMHRRHDISGAHFEALHEAFMEVLPRYVPADQRDSLCDAVWEPFWQVVVKLLTQGSTTPRGDWYAAQRRAEWMAEARAVLAAVTEQQRTPDQRGSFIPTMLDRAEAVNPAMSQFSVMREPRVAIRYFESVAFAALEIDDDAERARCIEQLAHEHIVYGLSEWGLRKLRQPFIDTSAYYVGLSAHPNAWTPTTAESLGLFWDMLTECWVEGIAMSRQSLAGIRSLRAPSGSRPFCMMFTDIEADARLWELYPSTMADAVDAYHTLLRRLISEHGAYEVKTDDDAFVVAAKDVLTALQIAVSTQLELMRQPIVEDFRMVPVVQGGGLSSCWRSDSLRVRIGIHYCTDASAVYDSVQRRFDYYGPSVNCAAHTASAAAGGQILITQAAVNALRGNRGESQQQQQEDSPMPIVEIAPGTNPMDTVLDSLLEFQWWGEQRFRGVHEPVSLFSVLPMRLAGRTFPYYVGSRKVRVTAPSDIAGRKKVYRLSLTQLKSGNLDDSTSGLFRS